MSIPVYYLCPECIVDCNCGAAPDDVRDDGSPRRYLCLRDVNETLTRVSAGEVIEARYTPGMGYLLRRAGDAGVVGWLDAGTMLASFVEV
jgi:hypothetical protein